MGTLSPGSHTFWVVTDVEGRITALSSAGAKVLGLGHAIAPGANLLLFFPRSRRHVIFDMEVALTGWPSARTAVLNPAATRPRMVRYIISRRVFRALVELHWSFDLIAEDLTAAS